MNKIVKVNKVNMKVELKNKKVIDVKIASLNFVPKVGMEVEVKGSGEKVVVTKATTKKAATKKTPTKKVTSKKAPVKKVAAKKATPIKKEEPNNIEGKKTEEVIVISLDKRYVSKATYLILCFFFGLIGLHKFYSGKVLLGVLYLFTGGLFGIGALVDFIRIIFKDSDENGHIII